MREAAGRAAAPAARCKNLRRGSFMVLPPGMRVTKRSAALTCGMRALLRPPSRCRLCLECLPADGTNAAVQRGLRHFPLAALSLNYVTCPYSGRGPMSAVGPKRRFLNGVPTGTHAASDNRVLRDERYILARCASRRGSRGCSSRSSRLFCRRRRIRLRSLVRSAAR
jgi:hypothetical protein